MATSFADAIHLESFVQHVVATADIAQEAALGRIGEQLDRGGGQVAARVQADDPAAFEGLVEERAAVAHEVSYIEIFREVLRSAMELERIGFFLFDFFVVSLTFTMN